MNAYLIIEQLLASAREEADYLEVGENISPFPEVKIIFDGYGYNEETDENSDESRESFALFVHKNSGKKDFEFPEHEQTPFGITHRPEDEICIFGWHQIDDDSWDSNSIDDVLKTNNLTSEHFEKILLKLHKKYFE